MNTRKNDLSAAPDPYLLWSLVTVGISAISVASVLIRIADAPAISIATYRVAVAALVLAPWFVHKRMRDKPCWNGRTTSAAILSGCFLALHFASWIYSLQLTSVASSVSLVSTTPLFVALFSYSIYHEKPGLRLSLGILFTIIGSVFIAGTDLSFSTRALGGDCLAIFGAIMAAGYLMAGQYVRRTIDLTSYTFCAYGTAALVLLVICPLVNHPLSGFSGQTYLALLLLALVPQLVGHTTFNWTLKFLPPAAVSILILGEPIGASLLAYYLFGETVTGLKWLGLLMLGTGIILGSQVSSPHQDQLARISVQHDQVDSSGEKK